MEDGVPDDVWGWHGGNGLAQTSHSALELGDGCIVSQYGVVSCLSGGSDSNDMFGETFG